DRGERAGDVLRHRLLVHQRLLALLALLALVAAPLLERSHAGRRRRHGARGRGGAAARRRAGDGLGTHRRGNHRPWRRAERGGGGRRRRGGRRRGGRGRRGREGRLLTARLLGGGEIPEQGGRALFERRFLFGVHRLRRLEGLAGLELSLRFDRRLGLGFGLGRGHLGRRAAAPHRPRLRRRRDRLGGGGLHDPAPLGRGGRF